MKVLVVGAGYVGLVTAVCLAANGHEVLCADHDGDKITTLQAGRCPIHEEGLAALLQATVAARKLQWTMRIPTDCAAEVALIAVGTPPLPSGAADLQSVFGVVDELADKLPKDAIVATKSTVPIGTAARIEAHLCARGRTDLKVVSLPEFLREGTALLDTQQPHRLIFGVEDETVLQKLMELHKGIAAPILCCERATAEMIKYASNAFLATKISFINEIANICERVGADVDQVAAGMGLDPRIGASFLRAGLGYGGSCFPKDTRALVNMAGSVDYDVPLLEAVITVNQRQRVAPLQRLQAWLDSLEGRTITLLGVAFKPGTDDIRESPAIELAVQLQEKGAHVVFCDPVVRQFVTAAGVVHVLADPYVAVRGADAVVLVTEWSQFVELDWSQVRCQMKQPYLFDGRNVLDARVLDALGFIHSRIGGQAKSQAVVLQT